MLALKMSLSKVCLCYCSRRNSRPSSARPAPPQIKKQENHPEVAPAERWVLHFFFVSVVLETDADRFLFQNWVCYLFFFCRGSSAKTSVPIILDGKRLSEDDDDDHESKQFVVEEMVPLPPGDPQLDVVIVMSFKY